MRKGCYIKELIVRPADLLAVRRPGGAERAAVADHRVLGLCNVDIRPDIHRRLRRLHQRIRIYIGKAVRLDKGPVRTAHNNGDLAVAAHNDKRVEKQAQHSRHQNPCQLISAFSFPHLPLPPFFKNRIVTISPIC